VGIEGELPLARERWIRGRICSSDLTLATVGAPGTSYATILDLTLSIKSGIKTKDGVFVGKDKIFGVHDNHDSFGKPGGLSPAGRGRINF
jgi:hypothetical protein